MLLYVKIFFIYCTVLLNFLYILSIDIMYENTVVLVLYNARNCTNYNYH